jgi:hypothetical protein
VSISKALERSAEGMTGVEWACFGHVVITSITGVLALPVLVFNADNPAAFNTTAGTVVALVLLSLVQHTWYAIKNRGAEGARMPSNFDRPNVVSGLATGGFIEGPPTPITSDLNHERIFTAEQIRNSPSFQAALEKFRQSVTEIQERESQDGDSPNT